MFIDHTVYSIDPSGAKKYPMLKTFGTALVYHNGIVISAEDLSPN